LPLLPFWCLCNVAVFDTARFLVDTALREVTQEFVAIFSKIILPSVFPVTGEMPELPFEPVDIGLACHDESYESGELLSIVVIYPQNHLAATFKFMRRKGDHGLLFGSVQVVNGGKASPDKSIALYSRLIEQGQTIVHAMPSFSSLWDAATLFSSSVDFSSCEASPLLQELLELHVALEYAYDW